MALPAEIPEYVDVVFKVLEIGSIIAGIILAVRQMGRTSAKVEAKLDQQDKVMGDLKEDIKALNKLVTEVAVQNNRLDIMGSHIDRLERQIDELRHGAGWITKPRSGVDGEYP